MAETDTKDVENTDIPNGANKDSGGANKNSQTKKLSADAPVFDVGRSPTLDPYAGPNGIRTRPGIVEPATIPPPQQQQTQQQQQQQQQVHQQQQQVHQQQVHQQQAAAAQQARQQNQTATTGQTTAAQQAQQAQQQQHLSQQRHSRTRSGYPQGIICSLEYV